VVADRHVDVGSVVDRSAPEEQPQAETDDRHDDEDGERRHPITVPD
jgi:hypothetical protein